MGSRGDTYNLEELSGQFGSEKDADCLIVFCSEETSAVCRDEEEPHVKRRRLPLSRETFGDPVPAHKLTLRLASDQFARQFERLSDPTEAAAAAIPVRARCRDEISTAVTAVGVTIPVLEVMLRSAAEVPAARAAIQFAYTGQVAASSVREALEVCRQGSSLRIRGCAEACAEVLKRALGVGAVSKPALDPETTTISFTSSDRRRKREARAREMQRRQAALELFMCSELWESDGDVQMSISDAVNAAKPLLAAHFCNAVKTLNTPLRRGQMLELPAIALEALLKSDTFGTDNESTVLLLLATWMQRNFDTTDQGTRERLCGSLRLTKLSRAYLYHVLDVLTADHESSPGEPIGWLPVDTVEKGIITRLARAKGPEREELLTMAQYRVACQAPVRPQCVPYGGMVVRWFIRREHLKQKLIEHEQKKRQQLQQLRQEQEQRREPSPVMGPCEIQAVFEGGLNEFMARGFAWKVCLDYYPAEGIVGLYLWCLVPQALRLPGSWLDMAGPGGVRTVVPVDVDVRIEERLPGGSVEEVTESVRSDARVFRTGTALG